MHSSEGQRLLEIMSEFSGFKLKRLKWTRKKWKGRYIRARNSFIRNFGKEALNGVITKEDCEYKVLDLLKCGVHMQ